VSETRDANPNPPTPDAGTGTVAPLDQVMLAMDVVDTLRHEQDLVAAELDEDRRQRDFIDQVQAIYESQGIDVPAAVIAEGVQALRENRFLYKPPARSWSVRLAELYVERGKWAARAALVLLLLAGVYVAIALPGHFRAQGRLQAFSADVRGRRRGCARDRPAGRATRGRAADRRRNRPADGGTDPDRCADGAGRRARARRPGPRGPHTAAGRVRVRWRRGPSGNSVWAAIASRWRRQSTASAGPAAC
jgi:hypothetical protein